MKTPPLLSLCNHFLKEELELDENGLSLLFAPLDAADAAGLYS